MKEHTEPSAIGDEGNCRLRLLNEAAHIIYKELKVVELFL